MPPQFVNNALTRIKDTWQNTTMAQRILIGGVILSVIIVFVLLIYWLNTETYAVLYSNLDQKDASSIVEKLKKDNVSHKLKDNGKTILVPENKVYDLRLQMAGEGKLQGSGVGFEIFDQTKIGQTDFVQHINYQRALQGELGRTIQKIPGVENARVHLVLPEKSLFIEEQSPATASVMISLKSGNQLDDNQVKSIVNLVSSSVEGLSKKDITVADTAGQLLYQPSADSTIEGLTNNQLKLKTELENKIQRRLEQMLAPIMGINRIIARVNAELDFSQKTIHKELYDPDSAVVRSEQKSEETSRGTANLEQGVPEPRYQGEDVTGQGSTQESTRTQSTTNFEINKEEQNIVVPTGQLDRLSVAVIVDGTYETQNGEKVFVPRKEEELERIRSLVQSAVGFDRSRGDVVQVNSMSFGVPEVVQEPSMMETALEYAHRFWKPLLNAVIILLFLLLVVRPLVLTLIRPRVSEQESEETAGLPEGEPRMALTETEEDIEAIEAKRQFDELKARAAELMEQNMEQSISLVRQWLKEENA